jgi:hypothetical protein
MVGATHIANGLRGLSFGYGHGSSHEKRGGPDGSGAAVRAFLGKMTKNARIKPVFGNDLYSLGFFG